MYACSNRGPNMKWVAQTLSKEWAPLASPLATALFTFSVSVSTEAFTAASSESNVSWLESKDGAGETTGRCVLGVSRPPRDWSSSAALGAWGGDIGSATANKLG